MKLNRRFLHTCFTLAVVALPLGAMAQTVEKPRIQTSALPEETAVYNPSAKKNVAQAKGKPAKEQGKARASEKRKKDKKGNASVSSGRYMALKTNVAYDAIGVLNLDYEVQVHSRMTVDIPVEMVTGSVFHPLVELYKFGILGCHIDLYICRDPLAVIGDPFDNARIFQRGHPHRAVVIIDLGVKIIHLELGHHVHHAPHLPVAEKCRRITVEQRDLVKRKLFDIRREFSVLNRHKLLVFLRVNDRGRQKRPCQIDNDDRRKYPQDHFQPFGFSQLIPAEVLLFHKQRRGQDE